MHRVSYLCALCVAATAVTASADFAITNQHADIGIGYDVTEGWDLHIHNDDALPDEPVEYEPNEAFFLGQFAAPQSRPAGAAFDFIGVAAGADIFRFPGNATEAGNFGVPYIGWATEEIPAGVFSGNIALQLIDVRGPGEFSVYFESGGPNVIFATSDGIDAADVMILPQDTHDHYQVVFTELGTYEFDLQASGNLVGGGSSSSDVTTYRFVVVPEPASLSLLGLGAMGLVRRRR